MLTRLDGIATILAKTAVRDTSLLALLAEGAVVSPSAVDLKNDLLRAAGREPEPEDRAGARGRRRPGAVDASRGPADGHRPPAGQPLPGPGLLGGAGTPRPTTNRLGDWELLTPLFRAFEYGGDATCMPLPEPADVVHGIRGLELMHHQAQVVAAAAAGHRTFLLADEPGLGKTAQALLAADAADAFPLLVVVPNVVKANWAHEAELWTPRRAATVIHGDGETIDGFADIVIVNYEILDRHVGWLGDHGFRGMVVDEAHFIKNKSSQRSQHVLELSERIRARSGNALLMALTGTPLINDIEDFRAIWQFLGWIERQEAPARPHGGPRGDRPDARRPRVLRGRAHQRHRPRHRATAQGRRRLRHPGPPRRRPAGRARRRGRPLDPGRGAGAGPSPGRALRVGAGRPHGRPRRSRASTTTWSAGSPRAERKNAGSDKTGDNVFTVMRRIGQAKAGLAADYAAQLARNVGKVVFFAKHIDVMDAAEQTFAKRGVGYASIRGDQTPKVRKANIEAFLTDPEVAVVVCSLTAAGVGLNLQVASNVVLAELSWTSAEQTQAIDRVHRIGQTEPVTAWRIIAAQTIDPRLAQLIDDKAGLAARALDGSDEEVGSSADVQLEALVSLLTEALQADPAIAGGPLTVE